MKENDKSAESVSPAPKHRKSYDLDYDDINQEEYDDSIKELQGI